jgi:hypothetical protein
MVLPSTTRCKRLPIPPLGHLLSRRRGRWSVTRDESSRVTYALPFHNTNDVASRPSAVDKTLAIGSGVRDSASGELGSSFVSPLRLSARSCSASGDALSSGPRRI